jgi:hypothetical protein
MGRKGRWYSDGLVGVEAALLEDKGLGRGARGDLHSRERDESVKVVSCRSSVAQQGKSEGPTAAMDPARRGRTT